MGTLHNQPARQSYDVALGEYIEYIAEQAKRYEITLDQAISIYHVAAIDRANELKRADGDIWDEQISGMGCILRDIALSLDYIANNIESK